MRTMTVDGLISRMRSSNTDRTSLVKKHQQNLAELCATHAKNVQQALSLFTGAASAADYQRLLSSTLTSAGLQIEYLSVRECSRIVNASAYAEGRVRSILNYRFQISVRADDHRIDSYYYLDTEGRDPDGVLGAGVFDPLFKEAFQQAAKNWFLAKL
jgi:hypothetical protein